MPGAVDVLSGLPASPEEQAKRASLPEEPAECMVVKALKRYQAQSGGPATLERRIQQMDEAGVEKALVHGWKMFSYHNRLMMHETSVDDIGEALAKYPNRLYGMAGYNPFRIKQSLQDIRRAVNDYGFRGVMLHIYGFDMYLVDPRMYPLYALCEELQIVVQMQVGHVLEAMPSKYGDPMQLDEISLHFPGLKLVGCHTGFPWSDELISCCSKWDNIYYGLTSWMPKYISPANVNYINSLGREKCVWGGPGGALKTAIEQIDQLGLRDDAKENLLWKTATKVFNLDGA